MPELPEIETIRRDLEKTLLGDEAVAVEVLDSRLMRKADVKRWNGILAGQLWRSFGRKGKYLWVTLANDWRVVFHMRMTGQLIVSSTDPAAKSRMVIRFASGKVLGLYDQRRFAEAWLLAPGQDWHTDTPPGPDALTELQHDQFIDLVKGRTTRIQPLLMDQHLLAGVGNIYAQEALFKAAIRPTRAGNRITKLEASVLFHALQETLQGAIDNRGSTSRNYRDAYGQEGSAQNFHAVYQKGGKPCPTCKSILKSLRVGGRGTVFCPQCQK